MPWDHMEATFSHFWSLALKEHFYFLWPVAVALARGKTSSAGLLVTGAIAAMTMWIANPLGFEVELASSYAVSRWTLPAALPILVGCLAACLLCRRTLPAAVARAIGIIGPLAFLFPLVPAAHALAPAALHTPLSSVAIVTMIAFLVVSPRSLVVKILELRPLVYLGTISYGIYVWQEILTGDGTHRQVPDWTSQPMLGAMLAVVLVALSYRFLIEPMVLYGDRLGQPAQQAN